MVFVHAGTTRESMGSHSEKVGPFLDSLPIRLVSSGGKAQPGASLKHLPLTPCVFIKETTGSGSDPWQARAWSWDYRT